jgi:hypothetical protein
MPHCVRNDTLDTLIILTDRPSDPEHNRLTLGAGFASEINTALRELRRMRKWAKKTTAKLAALDEHHDQHHAALDKH